MLLWKCLQLSLCVFFSSSLPPSFTHRTLPILKTFTHNIQHSIHLPNRCPQRKTALKNSHRWCYTPPASVTSQTAPHCSPHLTQPTPEACLTPLVLGGTRFPKRPLLLLLQRHSRCVYRSITALPVPSRHQHHTLLALISGPLYLLDLLNLSYLCCQLLLELPPLFSDWQFS